MTARTTRRFLAVAAVAAALALGASAVPAGAATHRALSSDDCEALLNVGDNINPSGSGSIFGKQARAIADGFDETAGDISDKKVKKALVTIGNFYDDLAGADNLLDAGKITVSEGKSYAKAMKVFGKAEASCVKASATIPPGITLPSGVTLPGGVTIPNITLPK